MNTKKAWVVAGMALGAGLLATTILLWNENQQLRREREALRAAADQPGAQSAEADPAQIAPEELARLKATESEVLRLRNQVSLLRKELAQSKAVQGQKQTTEAAMPLTETVTNELPGVFEAKLNARIPEGQTLAFGGWMTESGKRAVAFVYPTVQSGSGTNAQVLIRTTLMEVPPQVWSQLRPCGHQGRSPAQFAVWSRLPAAGGEFDRVSDQPGGVSHPQPPDYPNL